MAKQTFKKSERLSKKKLIQELFNKGSYFYLHPFKLIFLPADDLSAHQILISVPKRNHKTAVARNKIKRRIREAYRLNKPTFASDKNLLIAYIYTSKEILELAAIEKAVIKGHDMLEKKVTQ